MEPIYIHLFRIKDSKEQPKQCKMINVYRLYAIQLRNICTIDKQGQGSFRLTFYSLPTHARARE